MSTSSLGNAKTQSDLLFEKYLRTHGYTEWTHEAPVEGKPTTPDYRLECNGSCYFFETKEFEAPLPALGLGFVDAYGPLRQKINQAARQFKYYKEFSCSVVLANPNLVFVMLEDWTIFGAMLGDMGTRAGINVPKGVANPVEHVFTTGGKMVNDKRRTPQNTTINSVIVLSRRPLSQSLIPVTMPESEESLSVRVKVYENPFARIPLSRNLFRGCYDERFGFEQGRRVRLFAGTEILRIEDTAPKSNG